MRLNIIINIEKYKNKLIEYKHASYNCKKMANFKNW